MMCYILHTKDHKLKPWFGFNDDRKHVTHAKQIHNKCTIFLLCIDFDL